MVQVHHMEESNQSTDTQPSGEDGAPMNAQQQKALAGAEKKTRPAHVRTQSRASTKFTPPPTPKTSRESLQQQEEHENERGKRQRHPPFLRAFYHFHPTFTADSSTVTLPLNMGDVILVHSIHTNGWADGTLLSSGARGWLPTNYCEFYEAKQIRPLLRSCTVLFEQFRGASVSGPRQSQLAVTHVVAGVKYLLESTECLARMSDNVRRSDRVAKARKFLLLDLSALVKVAKRLPGGSEAEPNSAPLEKERLADDLILRTFKIVLRGVRFLDIWYDKYGRLIEEGAAAEGSEMPPAPEDPELAAALAEEDTIPPTPPADSFTHSMSSSVSSVNSPADTNRPDSDSYFPKRPWNRHMSGALKESHPLPSTPHSATPRSGQSPELVRPAHHGESAEAGQKPRRELPVMALGRLTSCHDLLLTNIGSHIGRIQYTQGRFTAQVQLSQQQSITAARELLTVVEAVCARDSKTAALGAAKDAMYAHIAALVAAGELVLSHRVEEIEEDDEEEGILMPDGGRGLIEAATGCVRGAGDCVAKSKFVIERIGDFELELDAGSAGIGLGISTDSDAPVVIEHTVEVEVSTKDDLDRMSMPPPAPPAKDEQAAKDEWRVPQTPVTPATPATPNFGVGMLKIDTNFSSPTQAAAGNGSDVESKTPTEVSSKRSSKRSSLKATPVPAIKSMIDSIEPETSTNPLAHHYNPDKMSSQSYANMSRCDSIGAESVGATDEAATNSVRGSEFSMMSRTSTRATTPEPPSTTSVTTPSLSTDFNVGSSSASFCESAMSGIDESPEDLTYNKEGQITGGTLPALIKELTHHAKLPDSGLISTFMLTFRQFTTPRQFAEALVDRFNEVTDNSVKLHPIRLRVFNVFKQWVDGHWRPETDREAVAVIQRFAELCVKNDLPSLAQRAQTLVDKITSEGTPASRTVTGKTTASIPPPDPSTLPPVNLNRSQLALLRASVMPNGTQPSICDFDPLELARQFTLKESRLFCAITPEELIAQEWTKKSGSISHNVLAMSALSTDLAHLVAETILDLNEPKARARVIKHWIKIAEKCEQLQNYDSLMAIMCTMNTSTIVRLKKTWELVPAKHRALLDHLRSVIDVSKNQAILRQRLKTHVPPCLPFLGTYLTDLTFIDVGNPSKRPLSLDGSRQKLLINFDKHVKTAKIIAELQRFQVPYDIRECPEMQRWIDAQLARIHNSKAADVQHLYRRSLLLEPREQRPPTVPVPGLPSAAAERSGLRAVVSSSSLVSDGAEDADARSVREGGEGRGARVMAAWRAWGSGSATPN